MFSRRTLQRADDKRKAMTNNIQAYVVEACTKNNFAALDRGSRDVEIRFPAVFLLNFCLNSPESYKR